MSDNIQKITRVLLHLTRTCALRIHVKLVNERDGRKENFHNLYVSDDKKGYLNLDLQSFLTLEIKDGVWAPDKSILINQRNIFQVIKGIEKSLEGIYNGGIFAVKKNGEIISYKEEREKHTVRIYNLGNNQRLVIEPAVILDENETTYEGVIMYINKTENYVELPIDLFEALYHTLKETNLFVYSQALANYYISSINKVEAKQVVSGGGETKKPRKKHPLSSTESDEVTTSTVTPKQTPEDFFNYKG
jgi:hypothetical protein